MSRLSHFLVACLSLVLLGAPLAAQSPAPTPPMGWNSWDAYGFTINEADFRANSSVLASLKNFGWNYAVIDEGWYMEDPFAKTLETRKYLWDKNGILIPTANRFPSAANGQGFKPLADWLHAQGLKFGVHIVRGIPRQVVDQNLPIAGSSFHAVDAADVEEKCPWDDGNYGVRDNAAGQAYYDSMLKLYAGWGLDYIKVDCVSDHPYRISEIRQIALAIKKTGRPIVLSLSPGPTKLEHADEVGKYAEMWRITDDHWDLWARTKPDPKSEFLFPLRDMADRITQWLPYQKPGNWPDPDMLPEGSLTPNPGWGKPRESRLTKEEQRTEMILWSVTRSPLIFGGNLIKLDEFNRALMSNKELMEINQKADKVQAALYPKNDGAPNPYRAFVTHTGGVYPHTYITVINISDEAKSFTLPWTDLHLSNKEHAVMDIFTLRHLNASSKLTTGEIPAHGAALFRLE